MNWQELSPLNLTKDCFWVDKQKKVDLNIDISEGLSQHFSLPNRSAHKVSIGKSKISLRVLNNNTAQNLLISLRGLFKTFSHDQIKEHILTCDTTVLNSTFVNALIKYLPQDHEIKQLYNMKSDGMQLADVEEFVANLGEIERIVLRLQCINFKIGYNEMVEDLKPDIQIGTAACEEILSSGKFGQILRIILSIGNFMNGPNSVGAVGFELASLSKLQEIKSTDAGQTLLHFIVEKIDQKFPNLLDFSKELMHAEEAARLHIDSMSETVEQVQTLAENLRKELNCYVSKLDKDKFVEVMTQFSSQTRDQTEELTKLMNELKRKYNDVAKYFAFDITKYAMNECLSDVSKFKFMFAKAHAEIAEARKSKELSQNSPIMISGLISHHQTNISQLPNAGMFSFAKN